MLSILIFGTIQYLKQTLIFKYLFIIVKKYAFVVV